MNSTMTFRVVFHRYSNGRSRLSAPYWVQAVDFKEANAIANAIASYMLSAMRETDPASQFLVAEITTDGLRGDQAISGWETEEELRERLAPAGEKGEAE